MCIGSAISSMAQWWCLFQDLIDHFIEPFLWCRQLNLILILLLTMMDGFRSQSYFTWSCGSLLWSFSGIIIPKKLQPPISSWIGPWEVSLLRVQEEEADGLLWSVWGQNLSPCRKVRAKSNMAFMCNTELCSLPSQLPDAFPIYCLHWQLHSIGDSASSSLFLTGPFLLLNNSINMNTRDWIESITGC